ncbi:MAG: type II secretion system protein GspG [Myxococcota bacterium]|jgi:hypothetical protein|nr:type II secretion system protein GspG [Myxococcota bacterium]
MFLKGEKRQILGDPKRQRKASPWMRRLSTAALLCAACFYVTWAMANLEVRNRIRQALVDISRIEHAVRLFRADHGRCPDNMEELVSPPGESRYMEPLTDPWGQPYLLRCPAGEMSDGLQVISGGPDGLASGVDNIVSL